MPGPLRGTRPTDPTSPNPVHGSNIVPRVSCCGARYVRSKTVVIAKLEQPDRSITAGCIDKGGFAEDIPDSAKSLDPSRNLSLLRNGVEERRLTVLHPRDRP